VFDDVLHMNMFHQEASVETIKLMFYILLDTFLYKGRRCICSC